MPPKGRPKRYRTSPAFPLYASDWTGSPTIQAMSPVQELAFFRLLAFAWQFQDHDCSLPDDPTLLAAWSRLGDRWATEGKLVRAQFVPHPFKSGRVINKRLHFLWRERRDFLKLQSDKGKASGLARQPRLNPGSIPVEPEMNSPSPSPYPSPSPNTTTREGDVVHCTTIPPSPDPSTAHTPGVEENEKRETLQLFADYLNGRRLKHVSVGSLSAVDMKPWRLAWSCKNKVRSVRLAIEIATAKEWTPYQVVRLVEGSIDPEKPPPRTSLEKEHRYAN